jgi:hypothetical protein
LTLNALRQIEKKLKENKYLLDSEKNKLIDGKRNLVDFYTENHQAIPKKNPNPMIIKASKAPVVNQRRIADPDEDFNMSSVTENAEDSRSIIGKKKLDDHLSRSNNGNNNSRILELLQNENTEEGILND